MNRQPLLKISEVLVVLQACIVKCPHCNSDVEVTPDRAENDKILKCEICEKEFLATVTDPTDTTDTTRVGGSSRGKICLMRRWWFPREFPLHDGRNVIGRADADEPSDIEILNDDKVSRRSIAIDVFDGEVGGYLFQLTVLKSSNVVLHNNVALKEGKTAWLNYGDTIVLGGTKLKFKK